jgi:glycosyltransferase involved in cell wall biosynthesis
MQKEFREFSYRYLRTANMLKHSSKPIKVLVIGNYPPPMCGWAIQTYLVTAELRRRGQVCEVLKINENRMVKSPDYVNVQDGWDYLAKIVYFTLCGYRLNVHVNGTSKKGYLLALSAAITGRFRFRPIALTFHGGLTQNYFPRHDSWWLHYAFRLLFQSAGKIACDSFEIKDAIEGYGINPLKITPIATFSPQYLTFKSVNLPGEVERFLSKRHPVVLSYLSFRPEYRLEVVREGMRRFRRRYSDAGFIWLGFPDRELSLAREFVNAWTEEERHSLLLLGNLAHDDFLTLLTRCSVCLRSPACDGVAASVLEALGLGVPVVASENGRRPAGVITYSDEDAADMSAKMVYVMENYNAIRAHLDGSLNGDNVQDNVAYMADWLTQLERR